jgi:hypothetical protein
MKTFVSITLAFAALSGIVLITSSNVVAQTEENAAGKHRGPARPHILGRPLQRPSPAVKAATCAPDDRKCEVERKLGLVNDPFDPRKGVGF